MKKVVRLTESDLIRIVKRVIKEGQSTPNVDLSTLRFSVKDDKGLELFINHKMYDSESILLNLKQTMFESDEYVKIIISGGLVATNVIMKTDSGDQKISFVNGTDMLTIAFDVSKITTDTKLRNEEILITGNVNGGTLRLILNLTQSTIKPVSESYRRRKY